MAHQTTTARSTVRHDDMDREIGRDREAVDLRGAGQADDGVGPGERRSLGKGPRVRGPARRGEGVPGDPDPPSRLAAPADLVRRGASLDRLADGEEATLDPRDRWDPPWGKTRDADAGAHAAQSRAPRAGRLRARPAGGRGPPWGERRRNPPPMAPWSGSGCARRESRPRPSPPPTTEAAAPGARAGSAGRAAPTRIDRAGAEPTRIDGGVEPRRGEVRTAGCGRVVGLPARGRPPGDLSRITKVGPTPAGEPPLRDVPRQRQEVPPCPL